MSEKRKWNLKPCLKQWGFYGKVLLGCVFFLFRTTSVTD